MNDNKKEIKYLLYAGIVCLISLSLFALRGAFASDKHSNENDRIIEVSGTGEITTAPDVATFTFSLEETNQDSKVAQEALSERIETVLNGVKDLGIEEKDIKTESYSISPKYEWAARTLTPVVDLDGISYTPGNNGKQVQVGFTVHQGIQIKLHDFEKISSLLILLTDAKVDNLYGPNFEIDDIEAVQAEAREEAITNAQEKAQDLARSLGVRLDDIISFYENNSGYPIAYRTQLKVENMAALDGAGVAPALPTGENTVSSQVTIGYRIR